MTEATDGRPTVTEGDAVAGPDEVGEPEEARPDGELAPVSVAEARRRSRRGPKLLFASRMVLLLLTLVSTITVARLVAPRDFGLAAMSTAILTFAQVFRDFGVTNAVLRKGHITSAEITMIFWFNVAATGVVSALLAGSAPFVSRYYGEPIVQQTMLVAVAGFMIGGLALQHRALINRSLRFGTLALIDIVGAVSGFVITLVLAFIRHDVWALVIGTMAQGVIAALLAVIFSGWRPTRPRWNRELVDLLKFGANSSVHSMSVLVANNVALVLIGGRIGASGLGQYSRAQALFALPNNALIQPITQSTMPLLTRLRPEPALYRESYLALVRRLCVLLVPLSVTLTVVALPLTRTLLGNRWHDAGLLLTVLAPALAFVGLGYAASDLFITQDRSVAMRNLGLVELVVRVGAVLVGLQFGLLAVAIAYTLATVAVSVLRTIVAGRSGPVGTGAQLAAALPALLPGAVSALGCLAVRFFVPLSDLPLSVLTVLAGVAGAAVGALLHRSSRIALFELMVNFGLGRLVPRRHRALPKPSATS